MKDFIENMVLTQYNVKNGVICIGESANTKFTSKAQELLFEMEDSSWWFQFRASLLEKIAEEYMETKKCFLDVGGGNGYTALHFMEKGWDVALIEPSWKACMNARTRGINRVICGAVSEENIRNEYLPQIMLLDVLEHIEDDEAFLKLLYRKLVDGGKLMITVPALNFLWSSEDDEAGHFRRYNKKSLEELAMKTGFSIIYSNYFFGFLVIPIWLVRHVGEKIGLLKTCDKRDEKERKKIMDSEFRQRKGIIGMILNRLEKYEMKKIMSKKRIRLGSSIVCVLEKNTLFEED